MTMFCCRFSGQPINGREYVTAGLNQHFHRFVAVVPLARPITCNP